MSIDVAAETERPDAAEPMCFVIMPISTPESAHASYSDADHFRHVLDFLFIPAIRQAGLVPQSPLAEGGDVIQAEIVRNLERASLVLCDISTLNANVFFELGIRTALDRPICLVRDDQTAAIPFDTSMINCYRYASRLDAWRLSREVDDLATHIATTIERSQGRNAMWKAFGLTQRGTDALESVPASEEESLLHILLTEVKKISAAVPPPSVVKERQRLDSELQKWLGSEGRNVRTVQIEVKDLGPEITIHAFSPLLGATYDKLEAFGREFRSHVEVWAGDSSWMSDGRAED